MAAFGQKPSFDWPPRLTALDWLLPVRTLAPNVSCGRKLTFNYANHKRPLHPQALDVHRRPAGAAARVAAIVVDELALTIHSSRYAVCSRRHLATIGRSWPLNCQLCSMFLIDKLGAASSKAQHADTPSRYRGQVRHVLLAQRGRRLSCRVGAGASVRPIPIGRVRQP